MVERPPESPDPEDVNLPGTLTGHEAPASGWLRDDPSVEQLAREWEQHVRALSRRARFRIMRHQAADDSPA